MADLDRLIDSIEGEGPSPEFLATLRERIVAETAMRTPTVDEPVHEIPLRPAAEQRRSPTRWVLVGLAAAAIALIVGFVALLDTGEDGGLETIDRPDESVINESPTTTAVDPATFVPDATPLTGEFSLLDQVTYRVDTLGTPFSITVDQPLFVQPNSSAIAVLTHPASQGPDDRDMVFMRLTTLADPAEPTNREDTESGWPADDFAGWLDNLSDEVVVANREETTLGGLAATRVDLVLGETDCTLGAGPCVVFATNRGVNGKELSIGSMYRIWVVDQGDEDPMAVIVGINRDTDVDWFDTADAILGTLAFGEVDSNPIVAAEAGPIQLPFLGGIGLVLTEEAYVVKDGLEADRVLLADWPGGTEFLANPLDLDGGELTTTDEVVSVLMGLETDVEELEATVIGGIDARVFDVASGSSPGALTLEAQAGVVWNPPPQGRLWVIEHPDRGLLVITAEAYENTDIVVPLAVAQTEAILESLAFVDLG